MSCRAKVTADVARETRTSMREADKAVKTIFGEITKALVDGERVVFRKFGSFTTRHKNSRMGRNPKNGKPALIVARTVVRFKSSFVLRDNIDNAHKDRDKTNA